MQVGPHPLLHRFSPSLVSLMNCMVLFDYQIWSSPQPHAHTLPLPALALVVPRQSYCFGLGFSSHEGVCVLNLISRLLYDLRCFRK